MAKWEAAKKAAKDAGDGKFLKVDDGAKVIVAIRGEPEVKESWFNEKENKAEPWTDEHKKRGLKKSTRFVFQVYNLTVGKSQVLEVGVGLFNDIVKADDKYDTAKNCFELSRTGKKLDTKWGFLFERPLTDDEKKMIAAAPLVDTDSSDEAPAEGGAALDSYKEEAATGPLDNDTQATIKGRLKGAGKEKASEYLKELGCSKISEIQASKKSAALALLDKYAPAPEEDPFA